MAVVGPLVEPGFSDDQAAIRGGSCGRNITLAVEHLASWDSGEDRAPTALWREVLGEIAEPCLALAEAADTPSLANIPADVFADQSKAFERLSIPWLTLVMEGWDFPKWVIECFLALIAGRSVRTCIGGKMGPARLLRCGAGMGGPASPFLWNLG